MLGGEASVHQTRDLENDDGNIYGEVATPRQLARPIDSNEPYEEDALHAYGEQEFKYGDDDDHV